MYRAIITPKETKLTIDLPDELVGKPVEALAFELLKTEQGQRKKPTAEEINQFYKRYQIDMSNFRLLIHSSKLKLLTVSLFYLA